MRVDALRGDPEVARALADLAGRPVNFDVEDLKRADPAEGWRGTDVCQALAPEPPGPPRPDGSWEIARRLMRGYEFADPSIVRAYYDPDAPLEGRTMLLKLQAFGLAHLFVGVRVCAVYEERRRIDGRDVYVWGWAYRTLEGHVEMGQMDWEVWKWADSGEVEFHVHSVSRTAPIVNPVVRIGFALVKGRERRAFLNSTRERMRTFVELALEREEAGGPVREAAAEITAHRTGADDRVHDALAAQLGDAPVGSRRPCSPPARPRSR
jgi:uncharacterized protein (UPF0548 family)